MGERRVFAKTIDCQRALYQIGIDNPFKCYNCGSTRPPYLNRKNYTKMCSECKSKTSVTRDTIFHNLRFGLLKGFRIMDEMEKSNYELSSIDISRKYEITQTTAWKFQKKIKENKDFVRRLLYEEIGRRAPRNIIKQPTKDNIDKLNRFLEKQSKTNEFYQEPPDSFRSKES